jgi:hypothetical protein
MQQTIETGQTGEIGQAGQAGDTTVRVLRAPMREIGMAWTSDGRTVSVLERQTSLVAARHAADRRRYIAERARVLARVAAEHQRLALLEQQLCFEIEARLEQLGLELQLKCADDLETDSGKARRRLSLQMLLAMLLAGEARTFLDSYRSEPGAQLSMERLQVLEQHADTLAEAIETIAPEAA